MSDHRTKSARLADRVLELYERCNELEQDNARLKESARRVADYVHPAVVERLRSENAELLPKAREYDYLVGKLTTSLNMKDDGR